MKLTELTVSSQLPERNTSIQRSECEPFGIRGKCDAVDSMGWRLRQSIYLTAASCIPKTNAIGRDGKNRRQGMKHHLKLTGLFRKAKSHFIFGQVPYLHLIIDVSRRQKAAIG